MVFIEGPDELLEEGRGVTGGLRDNYPPAAFHLTMVQPSVTDLITDVRAGRSRKVDQ